MAEETPVQNDTELTSDHVSALQRVLGGEVITVKEALNHLLHIVATLHRRVIAVESSAEHGDSTD